MVKKKFVYLVILLVFFLSFVSSSSILDELHLNIQTTNVSSGEIVTGTFEFTFNISNESDCSPVVYSNLTNLTTDSRGVISYYLENVSLDFDQQYYLCYYRDSVLINSSKIARTPYSFRTRNITISGVEIDSNLSMGSYNVTAGHYFGSGKYLTDLNVSAINLSDYVPYVGADKNVDLGAYNLTTTGTGFFGWLGSLSSRITKLFVTDINASGNVEVGGNFSVGTSDFFVDSSTNRVGIGTTSPETKLHLASGDFLLSNNQGIYFEGTGGGNNEVLNVDGSNVLNLIALAGNDLAIRDGATTNMFIEGSNGNVGIGTTTPQSILNINGTLGSLAGGLSFGDGDTGFYEHSDDNLRIVTSSGDRWVFSGDNFKSDVGYGPMMVSMAGSSTVPVFTFNADGDTGISRAVADQLSLIAGGAEVMRLSNISGVLTTEVNGSLDVTANLTISSSTIYVNGDGDMVFKI